MTTTNVGGLPGIPFKYHFAYDVRYRNAAISMDSDDMSFLDEYGNEEYSKKSTHLSNNTITSENYNSKLPKPSNESVGFEDEKYSGRSIYLSGNTVTSEGHYNYNNLQKPSHESIGFRKSPNFGNEAKYLERSSNTVTGESYNSLRKPSREPFISPKSSKLNVNNNKSSLQRDKYQLPSPTPSAEEYNGVIEKSLPSTPNEYSPSPKKKQKRYFSIGKSFSSLISNTRPKSKSKYTEDKLQIVHDNLHLHKDRPSETSLPVLTPSSPITHQFPENYFPEGFEQDDNDQQEEVDATSSTVDELCKLVLIMQRGFREMANEIRELKQEIRKLKGEEWESEENERDIDGRLRSVKSFTRQMERYGNEGRWFHNER